MKSLNQFLTESVENKYELGDGTIDAVILYGAGNTGKRLASILKKNSIPVLCMLDKNYEGKNIDGISVFAPHSQSIIKKIGESNLTCIISIFNEGVDTAELRIDLLSLGFKLVLTFEEFYPYVKDEFGDIFWLGDSKIYRDNCNKVELAYEYLSDKESKQLFSELIKSRVEYKNITIPNVSRADHYFPEGLDFPFHDLDILDCGAFEGDLLLFMHQYTGMRCSSYIGLEPSESFAVLSANLKAYEIKSAICFPLAVWSEVKKLKFCENGTSSSVSDYGSLTVQAISIDSVLVNKNVNYIKMDIEGAEIEALHGAADSIKKFKPILAISVYHKPNDIFEIPIFVKQLVPSYRLHIRQHGYNGFDTVLYALPE